jgi:fatty-acyl-CoA synthase
MSHSGRTLMRTQGACDVAMGHDLEPNPERQAGSIAYLVTRCAELHPNRVAVDDLLTGRELTYRELESVSNQLARALMRQGIGKGALVATMFNNEAGAIVSLLACAKAGAVVAPVNVRLPQHEVAAYLADHEAKAVLCSEGFCERFAELQIDKRLCLGGSQASPPGWMDADSLCAQESPRAMPPQTELADPFRMIPTGGTTGGSKGVVHSHGGCLYTVLTNIAEFGIRRGWSTVLVAPAYHGAGMDWGMFPILWRGGTVIFPATGSFNPRSYLDLLVERKVEFAVVVPTMIGPMYMAWSRQPIRTVRSLVTTSAATSPALRAKLQEMFPDADLMAGAGISESLNMAIQSPEEFLAHSTSIGEPHLDTRMCIVDERGRELPRGTQGEICLRGFNTALYYHRSAQAAVKTWRVRADDEEGLAWCFTGDIGVMDEEGRVCLVDRIKDVIITGGETVPSVEIENAYASCSLVKECAAVGLPDDQWGEAITLFVVSADPVSDPQAATDALIKFGRQKIAGFKVPKQIAFVDALPRSHFGKVLKRELRSTAPPQLHRPQQ